jgi:hypothetical protein
MNNILEDLRAIQKIQFEIGIIQNIKTEPKW